MGNTRGTKGIGCRCGCCSDAAAKRAQARAAEGRMIQAAGVGNTGTANVMRREMDDFKMAAKRAAASCTSRVSI